MKTTNRFVTSLAIAASTAAVLVGSSPAKAVVVASPTAIASATPFNGSFVAANAFNGTDTEYASLGLGTSTFIEMNFGSTVTFDRVILINRNSTAPGDRVAQSTFTFSTDNIFGGGDPTATLTHNSSQGQGSISSFAAPVSTQFARWDVDLLAPGTPVATNTGLMEMVFLNTPAGSKAATGVVAYNSATAFNANFVAANAVNGIAGRSGGGIEYASASQGVNTFVDFDMGTPLKLTGFDFIDRIANVDKTGTFNLLFSNDSTFSSLITTLSYSKGTALTASDVFANPITARFVRLDVTGVAAGGTNLGMSEIIFYQAIPEPATVTLGLLSLGGLMMRRRRMA